MPTVTRQRRLKIERERMGRGEDTMPATSVTGSGVGMGRDYDQIYKVLGARLNPEQRRIFEELAKRAGMTTRQYVRDVVFRQHAEANGYEWPVSAIGSGEVTTHGGKGRGGGRKRKNTSTQE